MKTINFFSLVLTSALLLSSCSKETEGCTDPIASNYDSEASIDNGTCIYDVVGSWTSTYQENSVQATASIGGFPILDTSYFEITHPDSLNPTGIDFQSTGVCISYYTDEPSDTGTWLKTNNDLTINIADTTLAFILVSVNNNSLELSSSYSEVSSDFGMDISISIDSKFEFSR